MALAVMTLVSIASLLLVPCVLTCDTHAGTPEPSITVTVYNSMTPCPNKTYTTTIATRGILLGAMRRLRKNTDFCFAVKEYDDYGPFLTTINGVSGDDKQHTYWQLVVVDAHGNETVPEVGVGCYITNPNDHIIFKFTQSCPTMERNHAVWRFCST